MKQDIPTKRFFTVLLFSLNFLMGPVMTVTAQQSVERTDIGVSFPNLYSPTVDFKLDLVGNKKFKVVLESKTTAVTKVKIYDIVGNLIVEDKIVPDEGKAKSFDFSHVNSHLFVVEVGNSKYNKTKSIYAQPAGTRPAIVDAEKSEE